MSEPKYVAYCTQSGHALFEGTRADISAFNEVAGNTRATHIGGDVQPAQNNVTSADLPDQKIAL